MWAEPWVALVESTAPCPVLSQSGLFGQEKRKRQAEIDSKRRQLEDDRRQLQHLKVPDGQSVASWQMGWWQCPGTLSLTGYGGQGPGSRKAEVTLTLTPTQTLTLTLTLTPTARSPRHCGNAGCWRELHPPPQRGTRT